MALLRELTKTKLSLYLRTQCDRELYFSLYKAKPTALVASGVPAPLKSRPNVQLVTGAGHTFETDQYKMLQSRLGAHAYLAPGFSDLDLANTLASAVSPSACIQPAITVEDFRAQLLANLGLAPAEQALIPKLSGIRPDLVLVRDTLKNDWEITPSGNRQILGTGDTRRALSVVDLKNVTEGNASYAAEVCLYAVVLSNWLRAISLHHSYYVSAQLYLWTRPELTAFDTYYTKNPTANGAQLLIELIRELERDAIDFLQFMPSVRKFFKEDVPRVIKLGDASGWAALDYHVGARCNACDWLGYRDWLSKPDEAVFNANPTYYCVPNAEATHHLSRVPSLSRGARQVLEANAVKDVPALGALPSGSPILRQHTFLKRERRAITRKAQAIITSGLSTDAAAKINTLSRRASLQVSIIVAFDASAGRLAGIGVHASFLPPFGSTATPAQLVRKGLLVARDADLAEWSVIEAFIDTLIDAVDKAAAAQGAGGHPRAPRTQLYLWEARQYEELCKAFGRHLARVLAMPASRQRALAWLFPADDLLEREDGAVSPAIVFVHDIVERVLHLPVTHVSTLLRVAEKYHHPKLVPNPIDTFYSEPFSNGIPRERTFEIWMNTSGAVSWGSTLTLPLADAMDRYRRVLANNAFALFSVVARLRSDFKSAITGEARPLALSTITGKVGVAFDSKMWSQWKRLDHATRSMELAGSLASSGERLESAYKAIVLTKLIKALGAGRYVFEVSEESLEAKIDAPHNHLTFGLLGAPGFPLETGYSLQLSSSVLAPKELVLPMYRVMRARLEIFDRTARRATVEIRAAWNAWQPVFDAVFKAGIVDVKTMPIFLMECGVYDDSEKVDAILEAIGDPSNASVDPNALRALGRAGKNIKPGNDPPSRLSRLLWQANLEAQTQARTPASATALANRAAQLVSHGLNPSQHAAVAAAAKAALSVLWGPPGTGKTDTLAALVHALVDEVATLGVARKILLTGPNYRAAEVLAERVFQSLAADPAATCDLFRAYSKSRELPTPLTYPAHMGGSEVSLGLGLVGHADLRASLLDSSRVTVVATSAHAASEVAALVQAGTLAPVFDVIIIDESSQVDVTLALRALATLNASGQVVIAGDHLQMPPIAIVDPPLNAEYLVGSIQTYFIERFGLTPNPLTINYRSNQTIVDYALTLGYPPALAAHQPLRRLHEVVPRASALARPQAGLPISAAWDLLLDPARPVCCLLHEDETSSQANAAEARMVAALVDGLFRSMSRELEPLPAGSSHTLMTDVEFFARGIGIVTPHKAQRAAVLTELETLFPSTNRDLMADAVDTVERFQGGERHTIIVSFGVGDIEVIQGEEEFLLQLQRINVAVSRAMAKCIVLLPKSLAYHLPSERKVLKTAKAIKSYIEEFCAQRQKETIYFGSTGRSCEVRWRG